MSANTYITRFSAWAPSIKNVDEWNEWALGKRTMIYSTECPEIAFTDSMFRRRLSQISKMTIQVVHDLFPLEEDTKMLFLSFRGELSKQFKVTRMVLEDRAIMPAAFSLSLFNVPVALASMAFGLKGGYSAIYPGKNSLATGLAAAKAALCSGTADNLVFIYADEELPPEYKCFFTGKPIPYPFAFGMLLTRKPDQTCFDSPVSLESMYKGKESPEDFLKKLILTKNHKSCTTGTDVSCSISP